MGNNLPHVFEVTSEGSGADTPTANYAFVEGVSPSMRAVEAVIRELAHSDVPVLLLAEHGAGKHVIARRIHELSERSREPFRTFRCSAASQDFHLIQASGLEGCGTLFLEELAELNAEGQARLLKALPDVEDRSARKHAARLICGSARDLEVEVKEGRLREDLYYRISGVCLRLPPLRQRKEDILLLTDHFLRKYAQDFHRPVPSLSAETQQLFQHYAWPGNLRELEDAAKALAVLGNETIAMGGLRALLQGTHGNGHANGNGHDANTSHANGEKVSLKEAAKAASREAEKELILRVLTRTRWNRRRAAQELQISYKALLYKLKQIGSEAKDTELSRSAEMA
jgi:two-component system, NtrC family, response regulator AtoC